AWGRSIGDTALPSTGPRHPGTILVMVAAVTGVTTREGYRRGAGGTEAISSRKQSLPGGLWSGSLASGCGTMAASPHTFRLMHHCCPKETSPDAAGVVASNRLSVGWPAFDQHLGDRARSTHGPLRQS